MGGRKELLRWGWEGATEVGGRKELLRGGGVGRKVEVRELPQAGK